MTPSLSKLRREEVSGMFLGRGRGQGTHRALWTVGVLVKTCWPLSAGIAHDATSEADPKLSVREGNRQSKEARPTLRFRRSRFNLVKNERERERRQRHNQSANVTSSMHGQRTSTKHILRKSR